MPSLLFFIRATPANFHLNPDIRTLNSFVIVRLIPTDVVISTLLNILNSVVCGADAPGPIRRVIVRNFLCKQFFSSFGFLW